MKLADRIKKYEKTFCYSALKRMPLVIRVDGKAFHTFTKSLKKPFDDLFIDAMIRSAEYVAKNIQGFKVAYIQSDEATFCLTDYETLETEGWFDYKLSKVISISASMMSVAFNYYYKTEKLPVFDSRAFTVPKEEICNVLLWRAKDWERNSLQMYSRSFFSNKELHKKNRQDMYEMLHSIGKSWIKDLSNRERNGTFLLNTENGIIIRNNILPTYDDISKNVCHLF